MSRFLRAIEIVLGATGDVDFLVEGTGADLLHDVLLGVGLSCLNRTEELANYDSTRSDVAPVDVLYAHRPPSLAMLAGARFHKVSGARLQVPVVDAEGIIGLKVQAMANNPARRDRERDDIRELLTRHRSRMDLVRVREYYRTFNLLSELEDLLRDIERH